MLASMLVMASAGDVWPTRPEAAAPQQLLELDGDVAGPRSRGHQGGRHLLRVLHRRAYRPGRDSDPHVDGSCGRGSQPALSSTRCPNGRRARFPKARNAWAPDISRFNGKYPSLLLGVVVRQPQLGDRTRHDPHARPDESDYRWIDEGLVLRSFTDKDDWNAIDPNLVIEDATNVWLAWGSFWGGIKMRRIDPATGKLSTTDTTMHSLSSRPRERRSAVRSKRRSSSGTATSGICSSRSIAAAAAPTAPTTSSSAARGQ